MGAGTDGDGPPCALGKPRLVRSPLRAKKGKKAGRASTYKNCRRSRPCATHLDTHHITSFSQQAGKERRLKEVKIIARSPSESEADLRLQVRFPSSLSGVLSTKMYIIAFAHYSHIQSADTHFCMFNI